MATQYEQHVNIFKLTHLTHHSWPTTQQILLQLLQSKTFSFQIFYLLENLFIQIARKISDS